MTSAAHIHAKRSATIAEEKKIHCYSILLDQQNSALKKKKKKVLQSRLPQLEAKK